MIVLRQNTIIGIHISNYVSRSLKQFLKFILCVQLFCLHVYLCTTCMPSQKRASDPLGPKLWMVVAYHVGIGK